MAVTNAVEGLVHVYIASRPRSSVRREIFLIVFIALLGLLVVAAVVVPALLS